MHYKSRQFAAALMVAISMPTFGVSAQSGETQLLQLARDSAVMAGGAKYCKFDPDEIEEFIARAEARLSVLARDDYEKVLARLEFKNILDASSVREPASGCNDFKSIFDQTRRSLR